MNKKVGVQLYTVRDFLNTDDEIMNTFKKLKDIGYDNIQTHCALKNYDTFSKMASDVGLEICGTFDDFEMMQTDAEKSVENHKKLNTKIMGLAYADIKENMDSVNSYINKFNTVAKNIEPYGMKFAYHNHANEFIKVKGKTILDHLIDETQNVSFCFDTYWAQVGGVDIRAYIKKLTGRLDILHLKDFKRTRDAYTYAAIGDGNLNWEGIMYEAGCAGVKYYVVEQDKCYDENPFDALKRSREYIEKL